jgi:hypothetical protein
LRTVLAKFPHWFIKDFDVELRNSLIVIFINLAL